MSEPTQYDLVQDARLDAHERLITPQDRERYGIEYSFPVVGQKVSDDEFQQMMLSTAAGILDQGGRPFWLKNFDDASRTAQLTVSTTTKDAKAAINGFFYRLVQDMSVSFPMPSTLTTYHVCLAYDPLGHSRPEGPISVQVYAGPPPYRSGLLHVELWDVECKPSQLLSDAKVTQKRPKISPAIHVDYPESMPDPRTQLWGATCYIRHGREAGATYVATGSSEETGGPTRWDNLTSPSWTDIRQGTAFTPAQNKPPQYRYNGGFLEFRGYFDYVKNYPTDSATQVGWTAQGDTFPFFAVPVAANNGRYAIFRCVAGGSDNIDFLVDTPVSGTKRIHLNGIRIPLN